MEKSRRALEGRARDAPARGEPRAGGAQNGAKAELGGLEQRISSNERLLVETRAEIERRTARSTTYETSAEEFRGEVASTRGRGGRPGGAKASLETKLAASCGSRSAAGPSASARRARPARPSRRSSIARRRPWASSSSAWRQRGRARPRRGLGPRARGARRSDHDGMRRAFDADEEGPLDSGDPGWSPTPPWPGEAALDRLGPVNVEAVHELEEVGGRLEHLETQAGDLAEARKTLLDTIRTIDEESRRLFVETFEEVRENFQRRLPPPLRRRQGRHPARRGRGRPRRRRRDRRAPAGSRAAQDRAAVGRPADDDGARAALLRVRGEVLSPLLRAR